MASTIDLRATCARLGHADADPEGQAVTAARVVVQPYETSYGWSGNYGHGRWAAFVWLDGRLTDWDCSHQHHTAVAAEKCLRSHLKRVQGWLDQPGVTIKALGPDDLYEIAYSHRPGGTTSKRFRMEPAG